MKAAIISVHHHRQASSKGGRARQRNRHGGDSIASFLQSESQGDLEGTTRRSSTSSQGGGGGRTRRARRNQAGPATPFRSRIATGGAVIRNSVIEGEWLCPEHRQPAELRTALETGSRAIEKAIRGSR